MNSRNKLLIGLALTAIASLMGGLIPQAAIPTRDPAYVEPGLFSLEVETLSVIVTAGDSEAAARAVERVGGQVTSDLWLVDGVAATVPAGQLGALAARPGVLSLVANKKAAAAQDPEPGATHSRRLQSSHNKKVAAAQDPEPTTGTTSSGFFTDQAWPVAIDVGADQLHQAGITGDGVTIATVDSGLFFAPDLISDADQQILLSFAGQADFVRDGLCRAKSGALEEVQYEGYCLQTERSSPDGHGHGSHVAGIIGNQYRDQNTGVYLGVAPHASILSVRVLGDEGTGSYEDIIQGIQYVVENKKALNIRVLNLSLSAYATTPYFVDPLNRAAEAAWAAGIVVVAASGNEGPAAQTVTVPGNDPYVITVGALDTNRSPGDWSDDILPTWSSTGPTLDGFVKPDVLAPGGGLVSFLYNGKYDEGETALLAR
jgi:hypothetical protein